MGAGKYRKRPMIIEAMQLGDDNAEQVAEWCGGEWFPRPMNRCVLVPTIHGQVRASLGDWVIKGTQGEYYPVRADVFAQIYEPVS